MTTRRHVSTRERVALFIAAGGCCAHCGVKIQPGQAWELDHVRPLELMGADEPSNWQVLCRPCHRRKTSEDVSRIRKAQRVEARHIGAKRSSRPLPGGKASPWKIKIGGGVVPRDGGKA